MNKKKIEVIITDFILSFMTMFFMTSEGQQAYLAT